MKPIRVNILSESEKFEAQGVHTAFLDMVNALRKRRELEVLVNSRERCDLLHAHTFGPRYWRLRGPYAGRRVMTAHVVPGSFIGSLVLAKWWAPLSDWYLKTAYNSADVVLCVAPQVRRDLQALGVRSRLEVLTNPVDGRRFRPSAALRREGRRLLGLGPKERLCLCVGQIQPRKGVAEFIDTAARLPELRFVWLGGRPFKQLTAGIAELDARIHAAPANVRFAGVFPLSAMPALYNAADLFFFPSHQENCALAINEAMACGVPMLLRDNPEYLELYGKSFLKAREVEGYAAQIRNFFRSAGLRKALSRQSLRTAARFSMQAFSDRLVDLYSELVASSSRSSSG